MAITKRIVRSGIRTHAYMSRLRERSALDRSAILTGYFLMVNSGMTCMYIRICMIIQNIEWEKKFSHAGNRTPATAVRAPDPNH